MNFEIEKIYSQVIKDKEVINLINQYNISKDIIERDLLDLYSYIVSKKKCDSCNGLSSCNQEVLGNSPTLSFNNYFTYDYSSCKYMKDMVSDAIKENNLTTFACNIDNIEYSDIYINEQRKEVISKMYLIYNKFTTGIPTKGLYLYGVYGCGKSYISSFFAKQFANAGYKVIFAYFPELVRKIKSYITSGFLEGFLDELKEVDVLFFDDFGGELGSSFIRDEVIGAILQYRMVNNKLTFITSNLDFKSLHEYLSETSKDLDEVKAYRVEERIKALMEVISLKDKNYRL